MREFDREAAGSPEGAITADVMQVTVRLNPASKLRHKQPDGQIRSPAVFSLSSPI
jgi:hypothetical protein